MRSRPIKKLLVPLVLEVVLVAAASLGAAGCGDDDPPSVDAAVDAPIDTPIDVPDPPPMD